MKNNNSFKISQPKLPKNLIQVKAPDKTISDELYMSLGMIDNFSFGNQIAERAAFDQVIFKDVSFQQAVFRHVELTDVRFENCDLSNADFSEAVIHRAEFIKCKIMGLNLSAAALRNVVFDKCSGDYTFFRFSDCKQVRFSECQLRYADFQECGFSKVDFYRSDLLLSQIFGTKLEGLDFSNCEIEGMGVRIEDLYGAIVSPIQAVSLSKLMGLIIKQ